MTTTAEHLEGMTDAGKFEILATQALRFLYDECRTIVHLGTNAEGKTIPSPVDGFVLVPNSKPSRYGMSAFTLMADLKRKWLYDTATGRAKTTEDGDLVKAGKLASALREKDPEAEFCLYLCTNRSLSKDLMDEVYVAAKKARMSVEFLEQSKLRDFLDTNPDGQWLRQEHLGITADRLSLGLLRDLSARSLVEYRSNTQFGFARTVVRTAGCQATAALLGEPTVSLVLLVGPSGAGKTVLAQTLLAQHLEQGGIGIRVAGEVAEQAMSIHEAVGPTLRSLHGRLDGDAGRAALYLASRERPLWIVVDDVNRSHQPSRLIEKIISWARPLDQSKKSQVNLRILCPVWELHSSLVELKYRGADWIRLQSVRSFLRRESITYLEEALQESGLTFNRFKLNRFAEALKDDPILLGLFTEILSRERPEEPEAFAKNVIGHYVRVSLAELAAETGDLSGEYGEALDSLARQLLLQKRVRPERRELEHWFPHPSRVVALLKKMIFSGRICRSVEIGGEERVEFRHDRILEHFLAKAAAEILAAPEDPPPALGDPYFAPHIGMALAGGQVPNSKLDWLWANNPIAMVAGLRSIHDAQIWVNEITTRIRAWLSSRNNRGTLQRNDALYLLAETNSPHVLFVTEDVPDGNPHLSEARLRNGDARAGARALSRDFYPRMSYNWLESLIADARENNGPVLVAGLQELLSRELGNGPLLRGALNLAGYLDDPLLADSILEAFKKAPPSDESLLCFLWAGLRCGRENPTAIVGPMMERLLNVDDTSTPSSFSRRGAIEEALAFCGRHGFADSMLTYLTKLGGREEYRWVVASILRNIDHPASVGFMAQTIALRRSQAPKGGFFPYSTQWREQWRRDTESRRLSNPSLEALHSLWKNPDSPDWLQNYAFEVWAEYTDDLAALREVGVEGPFADNAIHRRAIKGDIEVASAIKARIEKGEVRPYWLQFFHYVWRPDFEEMLDKLITEAGFAQGLGENLWSNENYELAHALRDIPAEPSERLLLKHWPKLAGIPLFIQTALYVSTEESRQSAAEALAAVDRSVDAFEHVGQFFGFKTLGLQDRLRIKHVESLGPYLARIDAFTVFDIAEWCFRNDYRSWAIQNLKPVCEQRLKEPGKRDERDSSMIRHTRARWFPADEDLFAHFDAAEGSDDPSRLFQLERLFDEYVDAGGTAMRFFQALEAWVSQAPSERRRVTALAALQIRGGRSDLELLCICFAKSNLNVRDNLIGNVTYIVHRRTLE